MNERFELFTMLINRISRNIRKIENKEMAELNLRNAHISCLYHLFVAGSLTSTELCECCEEDKATISRAIAYLEKEGYLSCEQKTAKRYKSPLLLTEKGKDAGKKISDKISQVLCEAESLIGEKERAAFYANLCAISDYIEKISNSSIDELIKG